MHEDVVVVLDAISRLVFHHLYTTFARFYDLVAWTASMGQWRSWQMAGIEALPAGAVLEIGHGPGHLVKGLAQAGHNVVGVDLSPQMTRLAARRLQRANLPQTVTRAKVQALPFADGHFDGVLSTFPSEYIFDTQTLAEVHRVLRPGGLFVIIPAVWITGGLPYDRFAAWLNRVTGQTSTPYLDWIKSLDHLGFFVRMERIRQPRAVVLRVVALKRL